MDDPQAPLRAQERFLSLKERAYAITELMHPNLAVRCDLDGLEKVVEALEKVAVKGDRVVVKSAQKHAADEKKAAAAGGADGDERDPTRLSEGKSGGDPESEPAGDDAEGSSEPRLRDAPEFQEQVRKAAEAGGRESGTAEEPEPEHPVSQPPAPDTEAEDAARGEPQPQGAPPPVVDEPSEEPAKPAIPVGEPAQEGEPPTAYAPEMVPRGNEGDDAPDREDDGSHLTFGNQKPDGDPPLVIGQTPPKSKPGHPRGQFPKSKKSPAP